jgi:hypothetical protein
MSQQPCDHSQDRPDRSSRQCFLTSAYQPSRPRMHAASRAAPDTAQLVSDVRLVPTKRRDGPVEQDRGNTAWPVAKGDHAQCQYCRELVDHLCRPRGSARASASPPKLLERMMPLAAGEGQFCALTRQLAKCSCRDRRRTRTSPTSRAAPAATWPSRVLLQTARRSASVRRPAP